MRIAVFGGTGRVGEIVTKILLEEGHEVRMLVRTKEKVETHKHLQIIQGDAKDRKSVFQTIQNSDAVFSALGTDRTTTLTESVSLMIEAMTGSGIRRIVTIGTAGILESRTTPGLLRYEAKDSNRKFTFAAQEHHEVYRLLNETQLDWTIVCPTYLPDGPAEGNFRIERNQLPIDGSRISTADTARFACDELFAGNHIGNRVGIAY